MMPSQKQFLERKENIFSIIECLRVSPNISRRQLSQELHLSWGCISELTSILLDNNIVIEKTSTSSGKGRTPSLLTLNRRIHFLGIDINKMGLKGAICNLYGEKIAEYNSEFDYNSKSIFIKSILDFINKIIKEDTNIYGMGFAMQGIHNFKEDTWSFPAEKEILIDFKTDFAPKIDVPFFVEHDPECILRGSINRRKDANSLLMRLDRGIGAVMFKGNSPSKESLLEVGYLIVGENGERLHELSTLSAIEKKLGKKLNEIPNLNTAKMHFEIAGRHIGTTLGNICNLLPVDEIFLCGEMVLYYDMFSEALQQYYKEAVLPDQTAQISVVHITDAAFGAAKSAMERLEI